VHRPAPYGVAVYRWRKTIAAVVLVALLLLVLANVVSIVH
jgi:hypothetical protein